MASRTDRARTTRKASLPVHRLHDEDVERLLATGERREDLVALLGEDGYRELAALARRAAAVRRRGSPTVYVLPGLMGSRIGTRGRLLDDVLWLDVVEVAAGHLTRLALPRGARLTALGVMWLNTLKLKLSLTVAGFDARLHAYDWRLGVVPLARALAARIEADGRRDVLVAGHSMGGLVARAALAHANGRIRRIVQIGAPNGGAYASVLALRGVYPTVRKLAALDFKHSAEDLARIVFRTLPSLHELLPAPQDGEPDLFDLQSWPDDSLRPDRRMLADALAARASWPRGDARILQIIGTQQETVTRIRRTDGAFDYVVTRDGDGTVPRALATLAGTRAWYVAEKHGGLPNNGRVIAAVADLLRDGETTRLAAATRAVRRAPTRTLHEAALRRVAPRKVRWQDLSDDAARRLLEPVVSPEFHAGGAPSPRAPVRGVSTAAARRPRTLEVRISRGSIADANAHALVIGVFRNVDPSGSAAALDERLGGAIREFTLRRMFGGHLGQVFVLPAARTPLLAELVLFAGLGDFDQFGPDAQAFVAENVVRTFARTHVEDFATVLLGAGSGVRVAEALESQLRGYVEGLRRADPDRVLRRVTICEINARKFAALQRALPVVARRLDAADIELVFDEAELPATARPRRRRAAAPRQDPAYLLVNVSQTDGSSFECRTSLLTAGAKAAVLSGTVMLPRPELRSLLSHVEAKVATSRELARFGETLAQTLVAERVREGLEAMTTRALVVVHDREASQAPWEALRIDAEYPALSRGMSRRYASEALSVARWRETRALGERLRVLLVSDPTEDLPGAAREGAALAPLLARGADVERLAGRAATRARIVAALRSGEFDVLHFAGHGFFDAGNPGASGLICAGDELFRGSDLDRVADLPALVFFNACEAARVRRRGAPARRRAAQRSPSSSLAEAFLVGGVANFLGTHWPVSDDAALAFSTGLYGALLDGESLGVAVLGAREAVAATGSTDWADYVHYGNPEFRLGPEPV
jgi:CHAT domain-containing protein/pimeloyl-ACP methyl ester carboxylesterase